MILHWTRVQQYIKRAAAASPAGPRAVGPASDAEDDRAARVRRSIGWLVVKFQWAGCYREFSPPQPYRAKGGR